MAEDTGLKRLVAEEVSDQLDVAELIDGGSLEDGIDGGEVGASVGRQFGEQFGRNVGAAVGAEIHETLSSAFEGREADEAAEAEEAEEAAAAEGDAETGAGPTLKRLLVELAAAIRRGFETALQDSSIRDSAESVARSVTEGTGLEGVVGEPEPEPEEEAEEAAEEREADGAEEETTEAETEPELEEAADLENLRRETLTDFLGVMSYQDLQSVAKEVGVKANLSREEMTEEIIDTVAGDEGVGQGEDEGEGAETEENEGEANDEDTDGDDDSD